MPSSELIHSINTFLFSNQGVCHADRVSTAHSNIKRLLQFYGSRPVWETQELKSKAQIPHDLLTVISKAADLVSKDKLALTVLGEGIVSLPNTPLPFS